MASTMDEQEKKKIRPLYNEFQGYLAQAPTARYTSEPFEDNEQWEYVNKAIDRLNTLTGTNYDQFKIVEVMHDGLNGRVKVARIATLRTMLGGLITHLHGKYFYDEPSPLNGIPSTVINQTLSQQQDAIPKVV